MAASQLNRVLLHLRRQPLSFPGAEWSDGQLLGAFIERRDETAFAVLVRRHGPMVFGVCRRLLRHQQDAEDCFQATFIILARRAAAVVKRASLVSWLYGVAFRTAQQARSANARRQAREKQVEDMPHPAVTADEPQDWRPLLDEELNRLPEKYRTAVVLCELEGRPRRDAAELLRIPEGTLSSRLATARKMLAGRLATRGLSISGVSLAARLAGWWPATAESPAGCSSRSGQGERT